MSTNKTERTTEMVETEIDVTDETAVAADAAKYGVQLDKLADSGPGGGWPLYRACGRRDAMIAFLRDYGLDAIDIEWMLDGSAT